MNVDGKKPSILYLTPAEFSLFSVKMAGRVLAGVFCWSEERMKKKNKKPSPFEPFRAT